MAARSPIRYKDSLYCASSPRCSRSPSAAAPKISLRAAKIRSWTSPKIEQTHLRFMDSVGRNPVPRLEASKEALGMIQEFSKAEMETKEINDHGLGLFEEMKHRFLKFKKHKFLENAAHFQNLAKSQAPKFMVIACADSRVCPSSILGFQPGEAFTIRNVANLVPPFENGPTETNAALEFAVNSLEESINRSLLNLLTYPWIEKRVSEGVLSLHGGYYNFINCSFEKWTLDYRGRKDDVVDWTIKDRLFWS